MVFFEGRTNLFVHDVDDVRNHLYKTYGKISEVKTVTRIEKILKDLPKLGIVYNIIFRHCRETKPASLRCMDNNGCLINGRSIMSDNLILFAYLPVPRAQATNGR